MVTTSRFLRFFKKLKPCSHEFRGLDMQLRDEQGIVRWPCCKCGKEFKAKSGLEILKHGKCIGEWSK